MEVMKAKGEGKKAGGGDEKPSELLKAVREDLERLDIKQETHSFATRKPAYNRLVQRVLPMGELGKGGHPDGTEPCSEG